MPVPNSLVVALRQFDEVLANPQHERASPAWVGKLRQKLTELLDALYRQTGLSEKAMLAPVAKPEIEKSPGLTREVQELRQEHVDLLARTEELLEKVEVGPPAAAALDQIHSAGVSLSQDVSRFFEKKNGLALETVLSEEGAGD